MAFPFSSAGVKRRPALVLADTGDNDVLVARITSSQAQTPYDAILRNWQSAGLLSPSVVRADKLATLEKKLVERRLGSLTQDDISFVAAAIRTVFTDWMQS